VPVFRQTLALALILVPSFALSHQDRILQLSENGQLDGLPEEYAPASFHLERFQLRVGQNELSLPECVQVYFPENGEFDLQVKSSWYHQSTLPHYIKLEIRPIEADFWFHLLFELETLRAIDFYVTLAFSDGSWLPRKLDIGDICRNWIDESIQVKQ